MRRNLPDFVSWPPWTGAPCSPQRRCAENDLFECFHSTCRGILLTRTVFAKGTAFKAARTAVKMNPGLAAGGTALRGLNPNSLFVHLRTDLKSYPDTKPAEWSSILLFFSGFLRTLHKTRSSSSSELPRFCIYPDFLPFLDKEGNANLNARLQFGWLGYASAGRVSTDPWLGIGDCQLHLGRQL